MENNNWKWYEENSNRPSGENSYNGQPMGSQPMGNQPTNAQNTYGAAPNYNAYYGNAYGSSPTAGAPKKPKGEKKFSFAQLIVCMLVMALFAGAMGAGVTAIINNANKANEQQSALVDNGAGIVTDESKLPASGETPASLGGSTSGSHASEGLVIGSASDESTAESDIIKRCMSSVVGIDIEEEVSANGYGWYGGSATDDTTTETVGSGSGVIITSDGYIATNNHVVSGADNIKVYLQDGTEYSATLIGTDNITDLAILKIEAENLPAATLGSSGSLTVGDPVYAIGNPLGVLAASVSKGIISGLDRLVTVGDQEMTLMQTDASVNPGNSGGGLFNANGELIGIVNSKASGNNVEGIGFAIPIDSARSVLSDLMDLGFVSGRPYLGISMQDVYLTNGGSQSMFGYFSNYQTRVQVYAVEEGGPAANAGMRAGDVILTFDGQEIDGASELSAVMYEYSIGDTLIITVLREQEQIDLSVTLGERTK